MTNGQAATAEPPRSRGVTTSSDFSSHIPPEGWHGHPLRLLSHTHWDREWYLTLEQYRVRLVEVMDGALESLEDPAYRHFHADSQTILLRDYLAVRPTQEEKLRKGLRDGRVCAGPFYVLNDEFLCSGEAWVENLLFGAEDVKHYGAWRSRVCYVVDNFGHISQLPQIAAQFGLKYFYGIRGWPFQETRRSEFWLEGPDGSRLLALRHPWGYGLARELSGGKEQIRAKMEAALEKLESLASPATPLLLMNGIDHSAFPKNLDAILEVVREFDPEAQQVSLDQYFEELERSLPSGLETKRGEARFVPGLYDVLASRMPQKLLYERARQWLEDRLDPWCACLIALGEPVPIDHRKFLWRLFLENLPHDSICGCSMDEVHQDIQRRLEGCIEGVETLFVRSFDRAMSGSEIPSSDLAGHLLIFNPLPWAREEVVEAVLEFPEEEKVFHWKLSDESCAEVPFQLLRTEHLVKRLPSEYDVPQRRNMLRAHIALRVQLPPLGVARLRVEPKSGRDGLFSAIYGTEKHESVLARKFSAHLSPEHGVLENELLRAEVEPFGTWRVLHKATGQVLTRQNLFEHAPDLGDLYKRGQLPGDPRTSSDGALRRITLEQNGPLLATYMVEFALEVPTGVKDDHSAMRDETAVLKILSRATLRAGSAVLEFATTIVNTARDHEVRVLFAGPSAKARITSDSIFDVIERAEAPESFVLRHPYLQTYENTRTHHKEFVDLQGDKFGVAVLSCGLQEHQILSSKKNDTLALTLLRAVGWIYRESMGETRVPEAQCQGPMTARYALYPHADDWQQAKVKSVAREFCAGLLARHLFDVDGLSAPLERGQIELQGQLCFSTWKPSHDGGDGILRIFNPSSVPAQGKVFFPSQVPAAVFRAKLSEEVGSTLEVRDGVLTVDAGPHEIVTLRLMWHHFGLSSAR